MGGMFCKHVQTGSSGPGLVTITATLHREGDDQKNKRFAHLKKHECALAAIFGAIYLNRTRSRRWRNGNEALLLYVLDLWACR